MSSLRHGYYLFEKTDCPEKPAVLADARGAQFLNQLLTGQTADPNRAAFLVYLHEGAKWCSPSYRRSVDQQALVWFQTFLAPEIYAAAVADFGKVTFYHGVEGLAALACFLQSHGDVEAGCQNDPFADDMFLRMRGEYLAHIEREIEGAERDTDTAASAKGARLLSLIEGSAGTYDFMNIAGVSGRLPAESGDEAGEYRRFLDSLLRAVELDRDLYNQQVEARLPAAVELSVRQRVLVLCEDAVLCTQLKFALSHSRLETVFADDPSNLLEVLNRLQPDILVIEQSFKHFDGMDIAAHVRTLERFQAMPILALLRDTSEKNLTRAVRAGIDNRLTIPFSAANLALSVLNLLSRVEISRKLGGRDHLTGLYTKEALIDRLEQDLFRSARSGRQIAVMLLHLKNSTSPRADFMTLADAAKRVFRRSDVLGRYNETTLAVVLPSIDGKTVLTISERFFQVLGGRVTVETAVSISDGTARPAALIADVEIRLTRALGGSKDAAMGVYEDVAATEKTVVPRVLIADTDEAIVNLLTFFCVREGFEVSNVRNGTDLLDRLEHARGEDALPDILILESFLPGVDGFQVLERIHSEMSGRISVIMMSVRPSEDRVAKAFKLGAIDFVSKPFRIPEMIARIRNGLERTFTV